MPILTFDRLLPHDSNLKPTLVLSLTAEERQRSNHRFQTDTGEEVFLRLPRGTILNSGDRIQSNTGELMEIRAKSELVITVTAKETLLLLKAAYHLGNRHVPLEVSIDYLRLSPDIVLAKMLSHLGLDMKQETVPFYPESGAYSHGH
jgi:urease accessory protein